jgi:hypothetical protein
VEGSRPVEEFLASPDAEFRIARWEQERGRCPVHGGPTSECPDDERDWFPQRDVCWPAAQAAAANRLYDLIHEEQPFHDGSFAPVVQGRVEGSSPSTTETV